MPKFEFQTTPGLVCEPGCIDRIGAFFSERAIKRVLCVTDQGITALGLHQAALNSLSVHQVETRVFDGVIADPPESIVNEAIAAGHAMNATAVLGLGGGSSLDTAKLVALALGSSQPLSAMYGVNVASGPRLPLVLVPTTAGTGSEATHVAIVTTGETTKSGVVSPWLYPDYAYLDADLTLGLPNHITAATGIDAMVHAIEAYTSVHKKNPYSDMLAREALRLLSGAIDTCVTDGQNRDARQQMLLGSYLAGQAFSNAPVAAVHALAYPLGGRHHVPHGLSNALVLPHVLRFNGSYCHAWYAELCELLDITIAEKADAGHALAEYFEALSHRLQLPKTLREIGIREHELEVLADDAMLQTRLLVNNPRTVQRADALNLYQQAFGTRP